MSEAPSKIHRAGPWQIPVRATGVMCPDGKRRTVRLAHEADSFWTIPARLGGFQGTTITGHVMHRGNDTDEHLDLEFIPNERGQEIFDRLKEGK